MSLSGAVREQGGNFDVCLGLPGSSRAGHGAEELLVDLWVHYLPQTGRGITRGSAENGGTDLLILLVWICEITKSHLTRVPSDFTQ